MKTATLIAVSLLLCLSCKKKSTTTTTGVTTAPNTITLVINGKSYTATGSTYENVNKNNLKTPVVGIGVTKETTLSYFVFDVRANNGNTPDFTLNLDSQGDPTGLGITTVAFGELTENFSGGLAYDKITGTVTFTKNDASSVEGSLSIKVKNSTTSKDITGTFKFTDVIR